MNTPNRRTFIKTLSGLALSGGLASRLSAGNLDPMSDFPDVGVPEIQKELARDNVSLDPDDKRFAMRPEHARRIV